MTANTLGRLCASVCIVCIGCSPLLNGALAASGDTMTGSVLGASTTTIDATSGNSAIIEQQSGSGARQNADASGSSLTDVTSGQTYSPDIADAIDQTCLAGTGQVCVQNGSTGVTVQAVQQVTASSANLLVISQKQSGSGGTQNASVTGSATTLVDVSQIVSPTIALAIAQNCASGIGACVQSATPIVSTIAQQIISADAQNNAGIEQLSGSGTTQQASVDVSAQTDVAASQVVTPTTLVFIVQKCSISTGLCMQDLYPLLQTLAQQVVRAQAENNILIDQSGGSLQTATVTGGSATVVNTSQAVMPVSDIQTQQFCDIQKGLCIQRQNNNQPTYIFTDGTTTESGSYHGDLNTNAFDNGLTRTAVQTVAMGICPLGGGVCPEVTQLLFWMFGPLPAADVSVSPAAGTDTMSDHQDASHRGHETNVIEGIVKFVVSEDQPHANIATAAFGGNGNEALGAETRSLICAVERGLPSGSNASVFQWTAEQIARQTGIDDALVIRAISDPHLCDTPAPTVRLQKSDHAVIAFPIDDTGPLSSNALWNICVRSNDIPYDMIKNNPDRDGRGQPRTCSSYHNENMWYQPDLGIYFYWDKESKTLQLPQGYVAVKQ